jgi:3-oxoadipate enol-lactonase
MTTIGSDQRLVEVCGQKLRISLDGRRDAPWLVFSNSLATDLHLWEFQAEAFANEWRIIRYDYRGHGGSPPSIDPICGISELSRDLLGVMDAVDAGQVHHVGVSMGSLAGVAAAIEQPQRFRFLMVCNCRLRSSVASATDLGSRARCAIEDGMEALVEPTLQKWFGRSRLPFDGSVRRKIASMIAGTRAADFAAYAMGMQAYDLDKGLRGLPIPVSMLAGSDYGEIADDLRRLSEDSPNITWTSIIGAGHLPNIQAVEQFNSELARFVVDK